VCVCVCVQRRFFEKLLLTSLHLLALTVSIYAHERHDDVNHLDENERVNYHLTHPIHHSVVVSIFYLVYFFAQEIARINCT